MTGSLIPGLGLEFLLPQYFRLETTEGTLDLRGGRSRIQDPRSRILDPGSAAVPDQHHLRLDPSPSRVGVGPPVQQVHPDPRGPQDRQDRGRDP